MPKTPLLRKGSLVAGAFAVAASSLVAGVATASGDQPTYRLTSDCRPSDSTASLRILNNSGGAQEYELYRSGAKDQTLIEDRAPAGTSVIEVEWTSSSDTWILEIEESETGFAVKTTKSLGNNEECKDLPRRAQARLSLDVNNDLVDRGDPGVTGVPVRLLCDHGNGPFKIAEGNTGAGNPNPANQGYRTFGEDDIKKCDDDDTTTDFTDRGQLYLKIGEFPDPTVGSFSGADTDASKIRKVYAYQDLVALDVSEASRNWFVPRPKDNPTRFEAWVRFIVAPVASETLTLTENLPTGPVVEFTNDKGEEFASELTIENLGSDACPATELEVEFKLGDPTALGLTSDEAIAGDFEITKIVPVGLALDDLGGCLFSDELYAGTSKLLKIFVDPDGPNRDTYTEAFELELCPADGPAAGSAPDNLDIVCLESAQFGLGLTQPVAGGGDGGYYSFTGYIDARYFGR